MLNLYALWHASMHKIFLRVQRLASRSMRDDFTIGEPNSLLLNAIGVSIDVFVNGPSGAVGDP